MKKLKGKKIETDILDEKQKFLRIEHFALLKNNRLRALRNIFL